MTNLGIIRQELRYLKLIPSINSTDPALLTLNTITPGTNITGQNISYVINVNMVLYLKAIMIISCLKRYKVIKIDKIYLVNGINYG